jgi:hypothetical protein
MNASDNLVQLFPDRVSQLRGPVLKYFSRLTPFNGKEQDLYMAVFRPTYRKVLPFKPFPAFVIAQNPGINTPQDYANMINKRPPVKLSTPEENALLELASKIKVNADSLKKLINFESGWNPLAKNPYSGARGLIQFMPSTAASFGYPTYVPPVDVTKVDTKPKTPPAGVVIEAGKVKTDFIFPVIALVTVGAVLYFRNKGVS